MSPRERIFRQIRGEAIDRIPSLGGWIGGAPVLAALAGTSKDQYLADPLAATVQAHKALDIDGMVNPLCPTRWDQVRTHAALEEKFLDVEAEAVRDFADNIPDSEKEILSVYDPGAVEKGYRDFFETAFKRWEGIVPVPNFWEIGGPFPLYYDFGYVAFLSACAVYPESVGKIWWARSVRARESAKILVRLYRELDLVPLMFCGEDLCNNQGPMASPDFIRKHYFPHVKMIIDPLVEAGIRLIHHCDGDVRPVIDDYLQLGYSGFQGFQLELGIDPYEIRRKRSIRGEELLFFTGLSVSRTLPFGTAEDVRDEVDYFFDFTEGGRGMFLFTTNVTGVEVPPENLRTAYHYVKTLTPGKTRSSPHRRWPWLANHGDVLMNAHVERTGHSSS